MGKSITKFASEPIVKFAFHHRRNKHEEITKTKEARIAALIEPALSELLALKNQGVAKPTIFGISVYWASHLLRELLDKLMSDGLLKENVSGWHVCRHSTTTRAFRARMRPDVIRDQLGHKDFDMTFYYSHAGRDDLLEEAKKLEKIVIERQ